MNVEPQAARRETGSSVIRKQDTGGLLDRDAQRFNFTTVQGQCLGKGLELNGQWVYGLNGCQSDPGVGQNGWPMT
jgi:hypothetical protein